MSPFASSFPLAPNHCSPLPLAIPHYHLCPRVIHKCSLANFFTLFHLVTPSIIPSDSCQFVPFVHTSVSIVFFYFVHKIQHISEMIRYLPFSDWLISLSLILSRSIHAVAKGKVSFSFMTK